MPLPGDSHQAVKFFHISCVSAEELQRTAQLCNNKFFKELTFLTMKKNQVQCPFWIEKFNAFIKIAAQ